MSAKPPKINRLYHTHSLILLFLFIAFTPAFSTNLYSTLPNSESGEFDAEIGEYAGYLFVYFTGNSGNQEAIRFAVSEDGKKFNALNKNNPVLSSSAISESGGVRDPHIVRGADGIFYMVATDMVSAKGWNSNRGMVLLKSPDLIHWSSVAINITKTYPLFFGNVIRVWAPETIYDKTNGKYMIYFSMLRTGENFDKLYYVYANESFTGFEFSPIGFFQNPTQGMIDANIVEKDSIFHLFYKTEGSGNGIKKATSKNLTGTYTLFNNYLQPNTSPVEGECVFKSLNSETWYMMYDVYTRGYYEFTKSTDLKHFTVTNEFTLDFNPRHGTIIPITKEEITRLKTNSIVYTGITAMKDEIKLPSDDTTTQKVVSVNGFYISRGNYKKIDVIDIYGKKILTCELIEGTNFIDVPSGVYIIKEDKTD
jgi:hypothetical protein